ncbi:MAG: sulfite exporter TauE/SafE family protein [Rhodospirillales bacterium]|nr:sulfite exporter TauE/SafE family protein [Rhodospirillales bacterium]QQS12043.1 MAG: sulfite exporter TauE/SafE family protein [Rhodospirillales bacterium]
MEITTHYIVAVTVAFLVAGVIKGAVGQGLPPTAIAISLAFGLPPGEALALMTIPTLVSNAWQALDGPHFKAMLARFWPLGAPFAVGVIVAAAAAGSLGSGGSIAWLGLILAAFAVTALVAWRPRVAKRHEPWANPLCGAVSGAIGGATGIAAVPFLPYMQSLELTKDELVQALGILFLFFTGAMTVALWFTGHANTGNMVNATLATIPTSAGMWLGVRLRRSIPPEAFRKLFLLAMLAFGLYLAKGLWP